MAQNKNQASDVKLFVTKAFNTALEKYATNVAVLDKVKQFRTDKKSNPLEPFGSSDKLFAGGALKGYAHAHLTHDVSIIYTLKGSNPKVLTLYDIGTHDEFGTGTPANQKRQQQLATRLGNQQPIEVTAAAAQEKTKEQERKEREKAAALERNKKYYSERLENFLSPETIAEIRRIFG